MQQERLKCYNKWWCSVVVLLAACAAKPPPKVEMPTDVVLLQGQLSASEDVNPGPDGRAAPVLVRLYELASDDVFNGADFFTLFDHETAVLGAALLRVRDFQLVPGQVVEITGQADPRTQYLGVIAGIRDLDAAPWRAAAPVPPKTVKPSLPHQVTAQVSVSRQGVSLILALPPEAAPVVATPSPQP